MITKISAFNFRNYDELNFSFTKNIVLLHGSKNVGKTAILETIYFSTFEKSFRTNFIKDLIKKDKEHSFISIEYKNENSENNIFTSNIKENVLQHLFNKKNANVRDFKNYSFPIFIDSNVLKNFDEKRDFKLDIFDNIISIDKKVYFSLIKDFKKLFTTYQNAISIKSYHDSLKISIIEQLLNLEYEILKLRTNFILNLQNFFLKNTTKYLNKEIKIEYKTQFKNLNDLKKGLMNEKNTITILDDDYVFTSKNLEFNNFNSKKDKNFLNILFFISFIEYIAKEYNQEFPLLLDDIFNEIDERNYSLLFQIIKEKNINVFISNSDETKLPITILNDVQIIYI